VCTDFVLLHDESGVWTDYVRVDLKGKNIQKLPGLVKRQKTKRKSGRVLCEPHRRHSRRRRKKNFVQCCVP